MRLDSASGKVVSVTMQKSTGDAKLDAVAIRYFGKWQFKRGTVPLVRVPITFTKAGIELGVHTTSNQAMQRTAPRSDA
jgi:hypothetical protein